MTLFKQISLLVTLMFLLLASVIIVNDFKRTGTFLQGQLGTTAQDMATTLGIAIGNLPNASDPAALEVLFNSVFDSGYYIRIRLIGVDGTVLQQKSQQVQIEGIPDWFLQMIPLEPATGSTQIMHGWTQLGQLELVLHPGYAYSGLYQALESTLKWFVILFITAMMLLWLMLKYLLLPLQQVQEQADAIHQNRFVIQEKIPNTRELRSVVVTMNEMVNKVKSVFNNQEKTLAHYQDLLYRDKLTGLGNRRYMLDQLGQSLADESGYHGCFSVIKLVNFELLRDRKGYQESDLLINFMARLLGETRDRIKPDKTSRLSDDEFAFLLAADEERVYDYLKQVLESTQQFIAEHFSDIDVYPVAALTALETHQGLGELLSGIDYSLTQANSEGPYSIEQRESSQLNLPQGKMQWRHWLEDVLSANRLFLVGQVAFNQQQQSVQKELFIRTLNSQNQVIPASAFMPMASGLGMAIDIDKAVFQLINQHSEEIKGVPLALNLSAAFFESADAQQDFEYLLNNCQQQGIQLCVEASHHTLLQHPEMCRQTSERVKKFGHQFGVDNLDLGQSLGMLQTAQFNYLKINANALYDMGAEKMSSAFQSLKTIADTMNIQIIAVAVDSAELFDALKQQGIEVMQGNYLHEPQPLKTE